MVQARILCHQSKHNLTNNPLKFSDRIKPLILLCSLAIYLGAFSMYVAAEEAISELKPIYLAPFEIKSKAVLSGWVEGFFMDDEVWKL
ncbi:MAG: hypothetical protein PVJ68_15520 [Candidatus Thiodiazotropha sp.]